MCQKEIEIQIQLHIALHQAQIAKIDPKTHSIFNANA